MQEVSVLDVRGHVSTELVELGVEKSVYVPDYDAYLQGHVPGAVFFNWIRDGVDQNSEVPVQLETDGDRFAATMQFRGVSSNKPVVVYDDGDGMLAARLWWALHCHGHQQVMILQGGWAAWVREDRPTELYEPCSLKLASSSEFEAQPNLQLRATAEDVLAALQQDSTGELLILDVRSPEQYSGQVRRGPRGGRIPGTRPLPRRALMAGDGLAWKPLQEQREVLQAAGVKLDGRASQEVILYCNGGVAACTVALALHRLGFDRWRVYDGSWNEWSARPELPVEV